MFKATLRAPRRWSPPAPAYARCSIRTRAGITWQNQRDSTLAGQESTGSELDANELPDVAALELTKEQTLSVEGVNTTITRDESRSSPLGRSYLYVPATAERMLEKSLTTPSDVIIYDLEDSVPPSPADKASARSRLAHFLSTRTRSLPSSERIAVRLNSPATSFFAEDIVQAMRLPCIRTLVLPKVHTAQDLHAVSNEIYTAYRAHKLRDPSAPPVQLVASIESARVMYNLGEIAAWESTWGAELGGKLAALLFAAEDYCADTGIIRTTGRQELLYTRSAIVVAAKAFKLSAIDMVCVNYKDLEYLRDECEDGRRLGFTGKQAIHPSQMDVIQSTFVPTPKEILRAAKILKEMEKAHLQHKGAAGLKLEGGGMEMIDAPMIKQAENVMRVARAAGLEIPEVD